MRGELSITLFWRVCLINGAVFALGTLALALSPATVSARPLASEIVVLAGGMVIIFVLNGLLLRSVLRPLDRLTSVMATIDMRQPGRRLEPAGAGPAKQLVTGFNAMVQRLEDERTASSARAMHAQEAERQRIAQELHDEVGQSLTAVLLGLKQAIDIAPPEVAAEVEAARDTTRASLEEVRRISQRLRPGVLTDLGLINSLSSLASDLAAHTGIEVQRSFLPGLPDLPDEVDLVVYRVAQEALTNVARHANASAVDLSLNRRGHMLILRVADDGVGGASTEFGAGIQGMHERALMAHGSLVIRDRNGGGTEVILEIPLPGARR